MLANFIAASNYALPTPDSAVESFTWVVCLRRLDPRSRSTLSDEFLPALPVLTIGCGRMLASAAPGAACSITHSRSCKPKSRDSRQLHPAAWLASSRSRHDANYSKAVGYLAYTICASDSETTTSFIASYTWSHSIDDSQTCSPADRRSYFPGWSAPPPCSTAAPLRLQRRLSDW